MEDKILTVAELIELLQALPQDLKVWHQGCDCYGKADGVIIENDADGPYVLITRSN